MLIADNEVTGYPTLKFFKKGSDATEKYRGQRDLDTLAKYVAKQLGQEPEEVNGQRVFRNFPAIFTVTREREIRRVPASACLEDRSS